MKKSSIVALVGYSMILLCSCGTSVKEKETYQQKTDQARRTYFGDTTVGVAYKEITTAEPSLVFLQEVEIDSVVSLFSPKNVFSTTSGIANFYHGSNFKDLLYDNAADVSVSSGFKLGVYETTKTVSDYEITISTKETPLSPLQFFQVLASLISKQPNGQPGALLTNGNWNIFHVKMNDGTPLAVAAGWGSARGFWCLVALRFDGWCDGYRVFARTIVP